MGQLGGAPLIVPVDPRGSTDRISAGVWLSGWAASTTSWPAWTRPRTRPSSTVSVRRRRAGGPEATGGRSADAHRSELLVHALGRVGVRLLPAGVPGTPRRPNHPFSPSAAAGRAGGRRLPSTWGVVSMVGMPEQPRPSTKRGQLPRRRGCRAPNPPARRPQGPGHVRSRARRSASATDTVGCPPACLRPVHRRHPGPEWAAPHDRRPPARSARRGRGRRRGGELRRRTGTSVDRRRLLVVRRRPLAPVLCEEIELRSSVAGESPRRCAWTWRPTSPTSSRSSKATPARTAGSGARRRRRALLRLGMGACGGPPRSRRRPRGRGGGGARRGRVHLDGRRAARDCVRATWTVDVALGGEWVERSLGPLTHGTPPQPVRVGRGRADPGHR